MLAASKGKRYAGKDPIYVFEGYILEAIGQLIQVKDLEDASR